MKRYTFSTFLSHYAFTTAYNTYTYDCTFVMMEKIRIFFLAKNYKISRRHFRGSLICMQPSSCPGRHLSARPPWDMLQGASGTLSVGVTHHPSPYQHVGDAEPRVRASAEACQVTLWVHTLQKVPGSPRRH